MITEEESVEVIMKYVREQAEEIYKSFEGDIEEQVDRARNRMKAVVNSIENQSKALKTLLPINLIEVITKGGFIKSKETTLEYESYWQFELGHQQIFSDPYTSNRLQPGKYRFTLIVEKLEE